MYDPSRGIRHKDNNKELIYEDNGEALQVRPSPSFIYRFFFLRACTLKSAYGSPAGIRPSGEASR